MFNTLLYILLTISLIGCSFNLPKRFSHQNENSSNDSRPVVGSVENRLDGKQVPVADDLSQKSFFDGKSASNRSRQDSSAVSDLSRKAFVALKNGRPHVALSNLERALKISPDDAFSFTQIARVYLVLDNVSQALYFAKKAKSKISNNVSLIHDVDRFINTLKNK